MKKRGKPIQVDYFYKFDQPFYRYPVQELYMLLHNDHQYTAPVTLPYEEVTVSHHAWERWCNRVSSSLQEHSQLQTYIQESLLLGRIRFLNDKFGLLNNDIVFYYLAGDHHLKINSFYGRINETPALANIDMLHRVIDVHQDKINLEVNQKQLDQAKILPLPICNIRYQGETAAYMFEVYETTEGRIGYVIQKDTNKRTYWKLDDPKVSLSKSIITALKIYNGTSNLQCSGSKNDEQQ